MDCLFFFVKAFEIISIIPMAVCQMETIFPYFPQEIVKSSVYSTIMGWLEHYKNLGICLSGIFFEELYFSNLFFFLAVSKYDSIPLF